MIDVNPSYLEFIIVALLAMSLSLFSKKVIFWDNLSYAGAFFMSLVCAISSSAIFLIIKILFILILEG